MVAYGFHDRVLDADLDVARTLGATVVEALPDWKVGPDPRTLRLRLEEAGLRAHSVHGCWGWQSIQAARVDLGSTDRATHSGSIDDLKRCLDWTASLGGRHLVVHPGGLSAPESAATRREALGCGLLALADHVAGTDLLVCVENMPPGVHPGSRMADLADLLAELDQPGLALALDTGHAHISASPAGETLAAGRRLRTTHVHDNGGRQDVHLPPGEGTIDWPAWAAALDEVGYDGPVMLECIRHLRRHPDSLSDGLLALLDRLATPNWSRPGA